MAEGCSASREIEVVKELIRNIRAGQAQDPIALAEAQERGFGVLMSLEAQLQRAQRGSADAPLAAPGTNPRAAAPGANARAELQQLTDAIHELSDALTELRGLASPAGGPPRVGYGFVLPGRVAARARRPTES